MLPERGKFDKNIIVLKNWSMQHASEDEGESWLNDAYEVLEAQLQEERRDERANDVLLTLCDIPQPEWQRMLLAMPSQVSSYVREACVSCLQQEVWTRESRIVILHIEQIIRDVQAILHASPDYVWRLPSWQERQDLQACYRLYCNYWHESDRVVSEQSDTSLPSKLLDFDEFRQCYRDPRALAKHYPQWIMGPRMAGHCNRIDGKSLFNKIVLVLGQKP